MSRMRKSAISARSLSRWLRRAGNLRDGAVTDLRVDLEMETSISRLVFVTASYSAGTPADLPHHLVVKSPLNRTEGCYTSEAQFYRLVAPALESPPLVRCFAAVE